MINSMLREVTAGYDLCSQADEHVYHNTKALLELYSKVLWRINSSLKEMDQECRESTNRKLTELINSMVDIDTRINQKRLNSRLQSIEESKSILDFIDLSMNQLKVYPDEGEKYFEILDQIYIARTIRSIERLAENYNISRSTMYREKNKAIKIFGVILWGFLFDEANKQES
ncbi:conserved protein of unknown function [Petrocella atlantisensis]|uniref:Uncharacterized protein n=1 Tax=Petrocella atlantisensis TaxID=2173034 RepID=A0A3P7PAQ3_9FIRM|nr:hypothetical protein [Petrocella atlantisensis]VDN47253.1 conserved protein of unknown function [Petrocella atlantisensis]